MSHRTPSHAFLALAATCAAGVVTPAAASAARTVPVFGAPTSVSVPSAAQGRANYPQIATNARGDEVVVWQQSGGSNSFPKTVLSRFRTAGGAWSAAVPVPIPVEPVPVTSAPFYAEVVLVTQVLLDADGNATVTTTTGGARVSNGSTQGTGISVVTGKAGVWGTPQVIAAPGRTYSAPFLTANAVGDQVLVWSSSALGDPTGDKVLVSRRSGVGSFGAAQVVETGGSVSDPRAAINDNGDTAVTWLGSGQVRTVTALAGGALGAPRVLSSGTVERTPTAVVVTPRGDTLVGWVTNVYPQPDFRDREVHARRVTAGGTVGTDQRLGERGGARTNQLTFVTDAANTVTAVWRNDTRGIQYANAESLKLFKPAASIGPVTADRPYWAGLDAVLPDASGGLAVAWDDGKNKVISRRPSAGAAFEAPAKVVAAGQRADYSLPAINAISYALSAPNRVSVAYDRLLGDTVDNNLPDNVPARSEVVVSRSVPGTINDDVTPPTVSAVTATQTAAGSPIRAGFTLSEGAKVSVTLSQDRAGAFVGGTCILLPGGVVAAPGSECTKRVYLPGSASAWFPRGTGSLSVTQVPSSGTYRVGITAKDAAGNQGGAATSITIL